MTAWSREPWSGRGGGDVLAAQSVGWPGRPSSVDGELPCDLAAWGAGSCRKGKHSLQSLTCLSVTDSESSKVQQYPHEMVLTATYCMAPAESSWRLETTALAQLPGSHWLACGVWSARRCGTGLIPPLWLLTQLRCLHRGSACVSAVAAARSMDEARGLSVCGAQRATAGARRACSRPGRKPSRLHGLRRRNG